MGLRQGLLQPLFGDEAQFMKARSQPPPVENLVLDRLLELALGHDAAVPQDPAQNRQLETPAKPAILAGLGYHPTTAPRPRCPAL
jgi:hypothetical protein